MIHSRDVEAPRRQIHRMPPHAAANIEHPPPPLPLQPFRHTPPLLEPAAPPPSASQSPGPATTSASPSAFSSKSAFPRPPSYFVPGLPAPSRRKPGRPRNSSVPSLRLISSAHERGKRAMRRCWLPILMSCGALLLTLRAVRRAAARRAPPPNPLEAGSLVQERTRVLRAPRRVVFRPAAGPPRALRGPRARDLLGEHPLHHRLGKRGVADRADEGGDCGRRREPPGSAPPERRPPSDAVDRRQGRSPDHRHDSLPLRGQDGPRSVTISVTISVPIGAAHRGRSRLPVRPGRLPPGPHRLRDREHQPQFRDPHHLPRRPGVGGHHPTPDRNLRHGVGCQPCFPQGRRLDRGELPRKGDHLGPQLSGRHLGP